MSLYFYSVNIYSSQGELNRMESGAVVVEEPIKTEQELVELKEAIIEKVGALPHEKLHFSCLSKVS